jgi:hypothetical protein
MKVIKVEYLYDYKLRLTFNNREIKDVDLSELVNGDRPIFRPLRDFNYFKQVKCYGCSITWPNEADICPDVLYKMGKDVTPQIGKRSRVTKPRSPRALRTGKRKKAKTPS